jgi:hypothetical protein
MMGKKQQRTEAIEKVDVTEMTEEEKREALERLAVLAEEREYVESSDDSDEIGEIQHISIPPIQQETIKLRITGMAPYMQHKFSEKVKHQMMAAQEAGQIGKNKKVREPKDFEANYEAATYRDDEGRFGIPADCFRAAAVRACSLCGIKMTLARMTIFVEADSWDKESGRPLVFIQGKRERSDMPVRNSGGVPDIRSRPMWRKWDATVRIRYDSRQFNATDIVNLLNRVGYQVGIGEGRPSSPKSCGLGFGIFKIVEDQDVEKAA